MATTRRKRSKVEHKRKISRASARTKHRSAANEYASKGGFPTGRTVQKAYDEADLARAIDAYKFFYPTVVGAAIIKGNESVGLVTNKVFGIMDSNPKQVVFTTNADTPYGTLPTRPEHRADRDRAAARATYRLLYRHQSALGGGHGLARPRCRKRR